MKRLTIIIAFLCTAILASAQTKVNGGPYLQNVTEDSFTVVWTTDGPAVGWVELAPDDGTNFYNVDRPKFYDSRGMGRKPIGTLHKVTVNGLQAGTRYRYRVMCQGVLSQENRDRIVYDAGFGLDIKSRPTAVTTKSETYDELRFAVVNDMHGHDEDVRKLFKDAEHSYDFVCFNGDMTSSLDSASAVMDNYMRSASKLFASDTPLYLNRGNHEYRGNYAVDYLNYYRTPTGKTYYAVRYGQFFFLFLDSGEDKADSDVRNLGIMCTEQYVMDEAEWLKEVTSGEEYRNATKKIAFAHIPPGEKGWHGNAMVSKYFVPVLNEAGLDLMICGHIHRYRYDKPGTTSANFPVLCNANRERLDAVVNSKGISIEIFNPEGTKVHTISF